MHAPCALLWRLARTPSITVPFLAGFLLWAAGIGGAGENAVRAPATETLVVTITTPFRPGSAVPVSVRAGDQFTLTLPSNATTGFQWRLAEGFNAAVVKSFGSEYAAPSDGLVGQGGTETWTFKALARGKTTLALEYARPWEKGIPPAKRQTFKVVVAP